MMLLTVILWIVILDTALVEWSATRNAGVAKLRGTGNNGDRGTIMKRHLKAMWLFVRSLATDDAYDHYLSHHAQTHGDTAPLSRRAFYLSEQQRKWTGVKRCC